MAWATVRRSSFGGEVGLFKILTRAYLPHLGLFFCFPLADRRRDFFGYRFIALAVFPLNRVYVRIFHLLRSVNRCVPSTVFWCTEVSGGLSFRIDDRSPLRRLVGIDFFLEAEFKGLPGVLR